MNDYATGKRMVEEMILEPALESLSLITGRTVTDEGACGFPQIEESPDFIIGFDGTSTGLELAEIRGSAEAADYFEEASGIAWKKHESYNQRRVRFPRQVGGLAKVDSGFDYAANFSCSMLIA